jgi:hypothetical protein
MSYVENLDKLIEAEHKLSELKETISLIRPANVILLHNFNTICNEALTQIQEALDLVRQDAGD